MEVMAFLSLTGEFELRSEEDFICGALTLLNAFLIIIVPFSIQGVYFFDSFEGENSKKVEVIYLFFGWLSMEELILWIGF